MDKGVYPQLFEGVPYRMVRRDVRYPRLEFRTGVLTLVLPKHVEAERVLLRHKRWILTKYQSIREGLQQASNLPLVGRNNEEFKTLLEKFVREAQNLYGVRINRVFIRKMRTKWASCSSRGNITVNRLAQFLPAHLLRYLVFHEAVHRLERRHNDHFWRLISKEFPNHNELEHELFVYWFVLAKDGNDVWNGGHLGLFEPLPKIARTEKDEGDQEKSAKDFYEAL